MCVCVCVCLCLCVCVQGRESPQLTSVTQLAMSYFYLSEGYSFSKLSINSPVKTTPYTIVKQNITVVIIHDQTTPLIVLTPPHPITPGRLSQQVVFRGFSSTSCDCLSPVCDCLSPVCDRLSPVLPLS